MKHSNSLAKVGVGTITEEQLFTQTVPKISMLPTIQTPHQDHTTTPQIPMNKTTSSDLVGSMVQSRGKLIKIKKLRKFS